MKRAFWVVGWEGIGLLACLLVIQVINQKIHYECAIEHRRVILLILLMNRNVY